ncbi:MAG: NAD(P)H-hydrate dehydratase [Deltaproteobacteria bacterium]|nr:NAD(P)H-hydrate dehydratase [Deltaproteobacteria bacterium]
MKLANAAQMRRIDQTTISTIGIPGVVLMENAGRETVQRLCHHFGRVQDKKIAVFAGPGNNGGDGFVVARHLRERGADVTVFLLVDALAVKNDAAVNLNIIHHLKIPFRLLLDGEDVKGLSPDGFSLIVDALFGTGLRREITNHFVNVIALINSASCPVVSVDVPSGVDSDTGRVLGAAVKADLTVTFALAKPGHFVYPGRAMTGVLEVVDIGIPARVIDEAGLTCELLDRESAASLVPHRCADSHKGTYGHVLVVAGSLGKTGAAILSGLGALRSGAGLVSLCGGRQLTAIFASALHEAMTIPVAGGPDGAPVLSDYEQIKQAMAGKKSAVLGPGLGLSAQTAQLVQRLYQQADIPLVVDADALTLLASDPGLLQNVSSGVRVLTPHPGEMARLAGSTSRHIQENRLAEARKFAEKHKVYLVLKGAGTIVASPGGRLAVNGSGNPGMAAGGMGDVLSGVIAGLMAQGLEPWEACCLGVFIHGQAADLLSEKMCCGYLAGEVAERVPSVIKDLLK